MRSIVVRALWGVVAVVGVAVLHGSAVHAAMMTEHYYFNYFNNNPGGIHTYATLDVTEDTTAGTVTFVLTPTDPAGRVGSLGWNTNLTLGAMGDYTITTMPMNWSASTNQQMDGFGKFSVEDGASADADRMPSATIVLTLADPAKALIENFVDFSKKGNGDPTSYLFAAHYYPPGATTSTGFIATDGGPFIREIIPEPASATLLFAAFAGCGGIAGFRRLRRKV